MPRHRPRTARASYLLGVLAVLSLGLAGCVFLSNIDPSDRQPEILYLSSPPWERVVLAPGEDSVARQITISLNVEGAVYDRGVLPWDPTLTITLPEPSGGVMASPYAVVEAAIAPVSDGAVVEEKVRQISTVDDREFPTHPDRCQPGEACALSYMVVLTRADTATFGGELVIHWGASMSVNYKDFGITEAPEGAAVTFTFEPWDGDVPPSMRPAGRSR
ncbi:MAG: hypothetical protein KY469_03510 [Actinobacteria bacterium]|nr:hypothetical protein [Actinomycetota bacterium]